MIYLTESPNDADLLPHFKGLALPTPVPHGDFCFFGKWVEGEPVRVSGDRKKLGDLLKCITDGRYVQQIQSAREAGFQHLFLIFESVHRRDRDTGLVQIKRGKEWVNAIPDTPHSTLDAYLNELHWMAGVQVLRSQSARETAAQVISLWKLFQSPPEAHGLLQKFHTQPITETYLLSRPPLIRRIAKELPGVSWKRSKAIEAGFESVTDMVNATKSQWLSVDGLGPKTVSKIMKELK